LVSDSISEVDDLKGHLSIPEKKSGRGVLLLHAWWGLNDFLKTLAHRFAIEGFVAFAPDYYDGKIAATIHEAEDLSSKVDREKTDAKLGKVLDYLKHHPSVTGNKIGVIGISLGTLFAVDLTRSRPEDVGAAILFYGLGDAEFSSIRVPIQGHFAETDEWDAGPEDVKRVEAQLAENGRIYEFHTYQGTTHWFLEQDVIQAYHRPSAELAFKRTTTFLKSHL
jgi:carboxymethylenebutenolidase